MISNCGKDEKGKYTGGRAGDQTGKEWHIIPWYNRPWNCVLRHPDKKVRKLISSMAKASAKNDCIGYDQGQRLTFWEQLKKVEYKVNKIKTNCEADCSSGVCSIIKAVGYRLNNKPLKEIDITTTHYMKNMLKKAGFEVLTDSKYLTSDAYLLKGDILLNEQHHTATNVTDGKYSKTEKPTKKNKGKKTYNGTFPIVPKNGSLKRGTLSKQVGFLQKYLNWYGKYKLNIDNDFGTKTEKAVKDFQKKEKLTVDGRFGEKSLKRAKEIKK